ncbi:thioredoxin family protein [Breznakia sp. OttesenSCG-928-G09]|nr:thioredoxin family protein [Breznakia sp. OttesenSCG-928-G09]
MKSMMKELSSLEEFEELYKKEGVVIFVFSADWCPDCTYIKPFLPKLIDKYNNYDFIYVDRDKFMDIAQGLYVMGIPSFIAVKNGKEVSRFVSKMRKTEAEIDDFLRGVA